MIVLQPTRKERLTLRFLIVFGANCIIRRKALDSIGGHAPSLSEDMHTAMHLYAKGWTSVYVREIFTRGVRRHPQESALSAHSERRQRADPLANSGSEPRYWSTFDRGNRVWIIHRLHAVLDLHVGVCEVNASRLFFTLVLVYEKQNPLEVHLEFKAQKPSLINTARNLTYSTWQKTALPIVLIHPTEHPGTVAEHLPSESAG